MHVSDQLSQPGGLRRPRVVRLTPLGRGAIATLLVEGPGTLAAVASECRTASGGPTGLSPGDRLRLVRFGPEPAEQVVLDAQGEDRVELNCHGGPAVVDRVIELLEARGCEPIDWRQSAEHSQEDPIAAAALVALAAAPTLRTAAILLDQYRGALRAAIRSYAAAGRAADAKRRLLALADRASLGRHLTAPWRLVVAGPPNAGKSTLTNALLGYRRALVHPTPGTTRDLVTALTAIDGWPVELVDTAGLGDAEHPLERAGMALAERELAAADLALLVFDRSRPFSPADAALRARWPDALVVRNKSDLPPGESHASGLEISAITGQGLESLLATIARRLVPSPPPPGAAVPVTEDQIAEINDQIRRSEGGIRN